MVGLFFHYYEFCFILFAGTLINGAVDYDLEVKKMYDSLNTTVGKQDSLLLLSFCFGGYYLYTILSMFTLGLVYLIQLCSVFFALDLIDLYQKGQYNQAKKSYIFFVFVCLGLHCISMALACEINILSLYL
mmetsp:Transcript_22263/g.23216  ORF Transcript_22263/g.23216 Transcript_22263/m.23216 type:complete len:131 (-) Transcript_22263:12-404(-)